MTDKLIIKEKGNQKCIFYNDDICRKGDKTRDCLNCARVEYHSLYKLNWENQERLESQLKAKEQECERLKHDNGYEVGALEKTIDNLKAENKSLKDKLIELLGKKGLRQSEKEKYIQTLTEIKEIAEKYTKLYYADFKNALILILQKISECEG